jgi:hypothetical protein
LGAGSNVCHQGAARESDDPGVVAATMARHHSQAPGRIHRSLSRARRTARQSERGGKPEKDLREPEGWKPKSKSCELQQEKEEAARVPAAAFRAEIEAIEKRSETKTPRGKGGGAKAACAIGPPAKWAPPNDAPPK